MSDLQIDYLNSDNTLSNEGRYFFSQSRCSHCGGSQPNDESFNQYKKEKGYKKSPFNSWNSNNNNNERNGRKKIRASDVDRRIIPLQTFRNRPLRIRNSNGTQKILKLMCTHLNIYIRRRKSVHTKEIHIIYTHLWHVCNSMQKSLEEILEIDCNWPIGF